MTDNNDKLNQLLEKLETLSKKQNDFSSEINNLRFEINKLKAANIELPAKNEEIKQATVINEALETQKENTTADYRTGTKINETHRQEPPQQTAPSFSELPDEKSNLEKFIGENLINKIGIAITVIGVAIGAEYAIDHQWLSPLTRIILGYLAGIGLLGFAIKLKTNHANFSAVLLSGAMAIMFFMTYSAYSFHHLLPQILAFILMVIFTAFTVLAAIHYNRQVIAHIGLVGAYAIPFLLSKGESRIAILFSYIAIINIGILAIAFKKYWKPLYYFSFGLTWLLYFIGRALAYNQTADDHFSVSLVFLFIFFAIFYATFLSYKLVRKEKFEKADVILLLANSFVFYAMGYDILNDYSTGKQLLGVFTLGNAVLHFMVSVASYRQPLADRNLFYLVSGLALVFLTLAIPVQLEGNQVTLLWAGEAALLFWIGRTKRVPLYEKLSYPIMVLAFCGLVYDWENLYNSYNFQQSEEKITPFLNARGLTSMLFIVAFGFIHKLSRSKRYLSPWASENKISRIIFLFIPTAFLFVLYYAIRLELASYWHQLYIDSTIVIKAESQRYMNHDLAKFKTIGIINYSLLFISALSFINSIKWKNPKLGLVNLGLLIVCLFVFLVQGLYTLSELRESYLKQTLLPYFESGSFNIVIRYISFAFVAVALLVCGRYFRQDFMQKNFTKVYDFLLPIFGLWIASSELINVLDLFGATQSYKLGLSILWGVYSLFLIVLGIWKKKKYLRVIAILLFSLTLVKLFLYDISHLDAFSKTVVFVSLGVLLLIISFLYNKYKHSIANETDY